MTHIVPAVPQPPNRLEEVGGLHYRHRCDHRALVLGEDQVKHLEHTLPPGR